MTATYRTQLFGLLGIAAFVIAAGMGLRDPWPADEPRFALIARDMLEGGQWLIPHVGGVIYPDKPPLFFWMVAAFYGLTGSLNVAFLLPGLLAGLGILVLVTDLARRLWGEKTAIWSGSVLLALVQFPLQMKSGQIDALLCLWTTLGLVGFARHFLLGPDWRWYATGGFAAGLGIITKGVGFLPYLLFVPYVYAAVRDWGVFTVKWRNPRWLLAPIATVAVVSCWLLPMLLTVAGSADPELIQYRDNILLQQTAARYVEPGGHLRPPWYLFTHAIPFLWMPVSLLLPWFIPAWRRDLVQRNAAILLPGGWILLVLLFFSLSPGKRSVYILPALPALALVAGYHARDIFDRAGPQRVLVLLTTALGTTLAGVGTYALMNRQDVADIATDVVTLLKSASAAIAIGIAMLFLVAGTRRRWIREGFPAAMAVFWLGTSLVIAPSLNAERSGKALIAAARAELPRFAEIGLVDWPEQFLLQWSGPISHFGYRRKNPDSELEDAIRWLSASDSRSLLMPAAYASQCFQADMLQRIGHAHRRNWVIAHSSALFEHCKAAPGVSPRLVYDYWSHGGANKPLKLSVLAPTARDESQAVSD